MEQHTKRVFDIMEKETVQECINAIRATDIKFAGTTYDRNLAKAVIESAVKSLYERFPSA